MKFRASRLLRNAALTAAASFATSALVKGVMRNRHDDAIYHVYEKRETHPSHLEREFRLETGISLITSPNPNKFLVAALKERIHFYQLSPPELERIVIEDDTAQLPPTIRDQVNQNHSLGLYVPKQMSFSPRTPQSTIYTLARKLLIIVK